MSKRDLTEKQKAIARRRLVMGSRAFQEFWSARQHIHPIPSDPYRAFMIDIALRAEIHTKEIWRGRTPRADYPPVDLPSHIPAYKRRLPSRKEERRLKRVPRAAMPYETLTELEKQLDVLVERMSEHYHVPKPRLIFEREVGLLKSSYFAGEIGLLPPFVKIGVKGQEKKGTYPQISSAAEHEIGHHVHAKAGLPPTFQGISVAYRLAPKQKKEREAWKFADPFMEQRRQEQKWLKKFALGTYLGTTPLRRKE